MAKREKIDGEILEEVVEKPSKAPQKKTILVRNIGAVNVAGFPKNQVVEVDLEKVDELFLSGFFAIVDLDT